MRILYNQTQIKKTLLLGIVYTILGCISVFTSKEDILIGFIVIGVLHIAISFWQKNRPYITIDDEFLQKDGIIKKKIRIAQIKSVKYFAGDYIIKSPAQEVKIDTNLIDKEHLPQLQNYFASYING
jgi:hypothetical protein